jgi:hypothetical protein
MKQDRAFERGGIRREGEKPCGRNVPGEANRGGVDSLGPCVEGAQNSTRVAVWRVSSFGWRRVGGGPVGLYPGEGITTREALQGFGLAASWSIWKTARYSTILNFGAKYEAGSLNQ